MTTSVDEAELEATIREIGLARFVGRINSGVVDAEVGYEAVDRYLAHEKERPFLSKCAGMLTNRKKDAYYAR